MASNVFAVNVYQLNQIVYERDAPKRIAFPTTGVLLQSCIDSPARSLSSGYNVYGIVVTPNGNLYYTAETIAQLITLANA